MVEKDGYGTRSAKYGGKKSTKIIAFALDFFFFRAILVHINLIPESAPGFFQNRITTFLIEIEIKNTSQESDQVILTPNNRLNQN